MSVSKPALHFTRAWATALRKVNSIGYDLMDTETSAQFWKLCLEASKKLHSLLTTTENLRYLWDTPPYVFVPEHKDDCYLGYDIPMYRLVGFFVNASKHFLHSRLLAEDIERLQNLISVLRLVP